MTTTTRTSSLRARWAGLLLAPLVAVLAMLLGAGTTSASGLPAAETRVGAIHPTVTVSVVVAEHIAAGQRRSRAPSQLRLLSGHCVAAEGGSALEQGAAKVPSAWGDGAANTKGVGTKWSDPSEPQANRIRIDDGVPGSAWPRQQVDHVVVHSGGRILGPDGEPIVGSLRDNPQAHIPLSDWLNWSSWNAP